MCVCVSCMWTYVVNGIHCVYVSVVCENIQLCRCVYVSDVSEHVRLCVYVRVYV